MSRRSLLCALLVVGATVAGSPARAATTITDCSAYNAPGGLQDAIAIGGEIVFACDGVLDIGETLIVQQNTSIDAAGHDVTLDGLQTRTIMTASDVTLRLSGLRFVGARSSALRIAGGSLTVEDGHFSWNYGNPRRDTLAVEPAMGGAIRALQAAVTIAGSEFISNVASDADGPRAASGGAIWSSGGTLSVENSTFSDNRTGRGDLPGDSGTGGAIAADGDSLSIAGSTFSQNYSGAGGGAIWTLSRDVVVSSSVFESNSAGVLAPAGAMGGALSSTGGLTTVVHGTTFVRNIATGDGGALAVSGTLEVAGSTFDRNSAAGVAPGFTDGGIVGVGRGGGIWVSQGETTIVDSTFTGNIAAVGGGGIRSSGTLTVSSSRFEDNKLSGLAVIESAGGGAIQGDTIVVAGSVFNRNAASNLIRETLPAWLVQRPAGGAVDGFDVTIDASTFSFNTAAGSGGAVNGSTVRIATSSMSHNIAGADGGGLSASIGTIDASTLAFNVAGLQGGGAFVFGETGVTNSTVYGNTSGASQETRLLNGSSKAGAALAAGHGTLLNVTVADNGGALGRPALTGQLTLINTIVAGDPAGANCQSGIVDGGHNIDSGSTCGFTTATGSKPNTDPRLRGLADNGGPTRTVATFRDSPAIDAGDTTACPARDQRGRARLNACDIGSFENRSA